MILTTTPGIEGRPIRDYRGIVIGTGSCPCHGSYVNEEVLHEVSEYAYSTMADAAARQGANAVVGIGLSMTTNEFSLVVTASGTAVVVD